MPQLQDQAAKLLAQAAGYVGTRIIDIGQRHGLIRELAEHPEGLREEDLAAARGLDSFYVGVWCRAAYAVEVLDHDDEGTYRLAPHLGTLLADRDSPVYVGALFTVLDQPEIFDQFADKLPTGEGTWWDQCSPTFIRTVAGTGTPFNVRLIPGGLEQVPGLRDRLTPGGRILELACGAGVGLLRLADAFPNCSLVGVDGDAYSLELAAERVRHAGLDDRVELVKSTLEGIAFGGEFDLVQINISMHEARDIEQVTANVYLALRPGGYFVISDFPFPDTPEGLRTVPGRLMAGIQCFEALIGDQLLTTQEYLDLLKRHGFHGIGSFDLAPVHAVIYGQK